MIGDPPIRIAAAYQNRRSKHAILGPASVMR